MTNPPPPSAVAPTGLIARLRILAIAICATAVGCTAATLPIAPDTPARAQSGGERSAGVTGGKAVLLAAYPGAFRFEGNAIVFKNGQRVVWDDGRAKTPAEKLTDADVEDMLSTPYPLARRGARTPSPGEDPGRVRSDAFFKALYGGSEAAVRDDLARVPFVPGLGGGSLTVTTRFGVDKRIAAISRDLERLPPQFHKYLVPPGGAFNWRAIAGTSRLSVHSFGAAVDINTKYSDYWRWAGHTGGGAIPYSNRIPLEIVEVFEKHCFIWGGRWYHYDTMHFEYRPELIPACHR
ncbi:M15 family metallopeptidase [Acuticoccus sp. MNP-M23]|uniref:M15 family metallopeptidase n=1 Tax=Acuticoccus sp. MNP-M23 TaxID=3072793 RepID=UPI002814B099|nr:M15 family metallopeptidase [Acuticoccus sp. MNP-M23]WMS42618.1 M15 family metallopeptidase [Acuticoccus sp. MNP-M23]